MQSPSPRPYLQASDAASGSPVREGEADAAPVSPVRKASDDELAASGTPVREASGEALQVAREIAAFFIYLNKRYAREFYAVMGELGLSFSQLKALHLLDDRGEQSVKEMAGELAVSLPAASRAIDGLHQRGMVDRREDDEDRRMKRVALSDAGRSTIAQLNALRFGGLIDFVASLDDADRDRLSAALEPIVDRDEVRACVPEKLRRDP